MIKGRSILLSIMTLMLCLALTASGTYALFTDEVILKTHLQAGNLDITLIRTHLTAKELDTQTGFLKDTVNPEDVDFSSPTGRNVFDITPGTLVVPCCKYTADMQIINRTDVAYAYWLEIVLDYPSDEIFASQIEVSVKTPDSDKAILTKGLKVGSEADPIAIMAKGDSALFTVSVEFLDLVTNNLAQGESVNFDLKVYAVQVTTAVTP